MRATAIGWASFFLGQGPGIWVPTFLHYLRRDVDFAYEPNNHPGDVLSIKKSCRDVAKSVSILVILMQGKIVCISWTMFFLIKPFTYVQVLIQ